jgi:hypothetical protein
VLECLARQVPKNNTRRLADVRRYPPSTYLAVPVEGFPENTATSVIEDRLENHPERFIHFRIYTQLRR